MRGGGEEVVAQRVWFAFGHLHSSGDPLLCALRCAI